MASALQVNTQLYHGLYDMQSIYSTDTQHMQMATQAFTEDGTKNTEHHCVSLEKQSFTNYPT